MSVVYKVLTWVLSFLPSDPLQEKFLEFITYISAHVNAGMTNEGNSWVTTPFAVANYFLPLDVMLLCVNAICVCAFAALLVCFGKTLYTWLTSLIGSFT